ncbi:hypothetical protein SBV1_1940014 [Verrucomicrobia bacterium]|nr:hypothetical protein SBV1_1940014 [Verrucomicrobiota bacterium]
MKTIICVGRGVFGVTAVDRVASKKRAIAEILRAFFAVKTLTTSRTEPGHANAIANVEVVDLLAWLNYHADNFVTWD